MKDERDRPDVVSIDPSKRGGRGRGGGSGGGSDGDDPSSSSKAKKKPAKPKKLLAEQRSQFTDIANARQFVKWYGNDIRFIQEWGRWIVWNGRHWEVDLQGNIVRGKAMAAAERMDREAKQRLERLKVEAKDVSFINEDAAEKAAAAQDWERQAIAWAQTTATGAHVDKMVHFAEADDEVMMSFKRLNQKGHLLNCKNGTLNLDTGELRRHQRTDYLTQNTNVVYDENADCPRWKWFIDHAMGGNLEMKKYLQRVAGYSTSGHVKEFAIFFHYGNGGRGKSTFLITLKRALGDYATKAPRYLLFKEKGQRHETEITVLYGKRFVFCSEVEENQKLDEGFVKDVTSIDPIMGRRMREDHWEFEPTHKAHVGCNYKPRIDGTDDGIWRRVHLVPWNHILGPKYKNILDELAQELSGILAWCVRGYLRWKKHGLAPPEEVTAATRQYREESDTVGQFLRECCEFGTTKWMTNQRLRGAYESYCEDNGIYALSTGRFNARLRAFDHGVSGLELEDNVWVMRTARGWRGVGLKKGA